MFSVFSVVAVTYAILIIMATFNKHLKAMLFPYEALAAITATAGAGLLILHRFIPEHDTALSIVYALFFCNYIYHIVKYHKTSLYEFVNKQVTK